MSDYDGGYVKSYRKILEGDIGEEIILFGVWAWILNKARWKPKKVKIGNKQVIIEAGSFLTCIKNETIFSKLKKKQVYSVIHYLTETERVRVLKGNWGMIITVCNWELYQGSKQETGTETELKRNYFGTEMELLGNRDEQDLNGTNGLRGPKKGRKEERKKGRKEEPTNYANDIFISSSMISDLEAVGMFWTDKDFGWLVSNEISFQSASISMRHFLHDLEDLDFNRFVESKIGFFKNALKTNGSYSSEEYLKIQQKRKKLEKEQISNHGIKNYDSSE